MCAFWFAGFLDVPEMKDFRYILRLDDDSCIASDIKYDIFMELQVRGTQYAFQGVFDDLNFVVSGLLSFVDDYVKGKGINPTHPKLYHHLKQLPSQANIPAFATNMEIIDTIRFRAADIANFSSYIMSSKMIFHRRWGDAPLRMIQALLFLEGDGLLNICDFEYIHSAWPVYNFCGGRNSFDVLRKLLHYFVFSPIFL